MLFETHNHLKDVWDYDKNSQIGLNPENLTFGTDKKAYFTCKNGHTKFDRISRITARHKMQYRCHKCKAEEKCLSKTHPKIASEWDYEKNKDLTPNDVSFGSDKKIWWKCQKGHSWKEEISYRVDKINRDCPKCKKSTKPKKREKRLFVEVIGIDNLPTLDTTKNTLEDIKSLGAHSSKKIHFICDKKHHFAVSPNALIKRKTLYFCNHHDCRPSNVKVGINDLFTVYPHLEKMWDYDKNKNINPEDISFGSNKIVWWVCEKGHSLEKAVLNMATESTGCSVCNSFTIIPGENSLLALYPELCKEWDYEKNTVSPDYIAGTSREKVWWKCSVDNTHRWKAKIYKRTFKVNATGCPYCAFKNGRSKKEIEMAEHIEQTMKGIDEKIRVETSYRPGWLNGQEIDVAIPEINLGFEFNGTYWHDDDFHHGIAARDARKKNLCKENNVYLVVIKEEDWDRDKEKVLLEIDNIIKKQYDNDFLLTE